MSLDTREKFVAASMYNVEKGTPVCNATVGIREGAIPCTYKYTKSGLLSISPSIKGEYSPGTIHFKPESGFYKFIQQHPTAKIYFDNLYFKPTEKIKKFIKAISRWKYNDDDVDDELIEYYKYVIGDDYCAKNKEWDPDSEVDRKKIDYYIVVVVEEATSAPYLVSAADDFWAVNSRIYHKAFKLNGYHIWSPFLGIIDESSIDFGGPWF